MNFKKKATKLIAIALAAATLTGMSVLPVSAAIYTDQTLTRISNPDAGPRQADGLVEGGERENSYAWCMASRGNYVYIGTNKDIGGSVVNGFAEALMAKGFSYDDVWKIADFVSNGEVPHSETNEGGQIIKVDCETNEMEVIYTAPKGVSFRMAITHGNDVFFGSYNAGSDITADSAEGLKNDIFVVDEEDNVESVYSTTDGTSMRAACEFDGSLFFGGLDASEEVAAEDEGSAKVAILMMDNEDSSVWNRVADYKDFGQYAKDPAILNAAASPIWDICAYDGSIYATLPGSHGFIMFKGHPAQGNETSNEYGWHWEEVVGMRNEKNPAGLKEGEPAPGLTSIVATPVVFKDELYVFDFDHTIGAESSAVSGIVASVFGGDVKASDYLAPMYSTLRHTQGLWKLNKETGVFEKVEGFSELLEGTANEYVWRAEVYNDQLYITTMDSAIIYDYITKLTDGHFIGMTEEEWVDQINVILNLATILVPDGSKQVAEAKTMLEEAGAELKELLEQAGESGDVSNFVKEYQAANLKVEKAIALLGVALANKAVLEDLAENIMAANAAASKAVVGVTYKIAQYIKSTGLIQKLIPEDMDIVDFSQLSDEELMEYFLSQKAEALQELEEMKVNIPELRMMSTEEILGLISGAFQKVMDSDEVQGLIAKVGEIKQKRIDFRAKMKQARIDILNFFFVDLPEFPEEEEPAEKPESELVTKIKEKVADILADGMTKFVQNLDKGVEKYNTRAAKINAVIEDVEQKIAEVSDKGQAAVEAIDWEGLAMYSYISSVVKNDVWGFDMLRTSDGENFEVVTQDGFGDKYNYGGRSMVATESGLYVGTANPFYGAQLYRLNDNEPEIDELVNTSTLDSDEFFVNQPIVVNGSAEGGSGSYTYEYYYKRSVNTKWNTMKSNSFTPIAAADYDIKVVAKDSEGATSEKILTVSVVEDADPIVNNSWLVADTVEVGDNIRVNGAASGGSGSYTYSFYFKRSTNTKWVLSGEEFGTKKYMTITPAAAADYDIKVIAKDSEGRTETKILNATSVEELPLTNVSYINTPAEVPVNKTVTISGAAVGGERPTTFKFYFKRSVNTKWNEISSAEGATYAKFTPTSDVSYDIKVVATDSNSTTAEKVFTITGLAENNG